MSNSRLFDFRKTLGFVFPIILFSLLAFIYYALIYRLFIERAVKDGRLYDIIIVIVSHVLLFMVLWSYFSAICVDPGRSPSFWGFYFKNPEEKRRNYCSTCHLFKPERCHHCSTCNRCVLNMDHHCPWLHNCVGFYNKKFFLLLLFYVWIASFFLLVFSIYPLTVRGIDQTKEENKGYSHNFYDLVLGVIACILLIVLLCIMTSFIKYHLDLLSVNKTTIESMDEERANPSTVSYDMGREFNYMQVFGKNKFFWPFPYLCGAGKPNGDGVIFPKKDLQNEMGGYLSENNSDEEDSYENNPMIQQYNNQNNTTPVFNRNGQDNSSAYNPLTTGFRGNSNIPQQPMNIVTYQPQQPNNVVTYSRPITNVYTGTTGNQQMAPVTLYYS